jgi:hypothetical protein
VDFPELIRLHLLPVLQERGFVIVSEDDRSVDLEAGELRAQAIVSPRGEFELAIFPAGSQPYEGWRYFGMVGRASIERLIELGAQEVRREPRILAGDRAFYAEFNSPQERHLP